MHVLVQETCGASNPDLDGKIGRSNYYLNIALEAVLVRV